MLPATVAALILATGALWWSQNQGGPETPSAAPAPAAAPTMRITAPGTDASAAVSSDKSATGSKSTTSSASTAGSTSSPGRAPSGGKPAATGTTKAVERQPAKAAVNTSGRNLALSARATSSSNERPDMPAASAIDNNSTTRWSSGFSDPQWLTVDLGKSWEISEVLLRWENAHATAFRVDLSTDGKKWKQVYSTTNSPGGDITIQVPKLPARLVRMYGTARSTDYGYSLLELEVR
jgi:hypothetical protein